MKLVILDLMEVALVAVEAEEVHIHHLYLEAVVNAVVDHIRYLHRVQLPH